MNIEKLELKNQILKDLVIAMPSYEEKFNWDCPCRCFMPLLYHFITKKHDFGSVKNHVGACMLSRENKQFDLDYFRPRYNTLSKVGFTHNEVFSFEYLVKFWEGETYEDCLKREEELDFLEKADYKIFSNGIQYVKEWQQHVQSEIDNYYQEKEVKEFTKDTKIHAKIKA